MEKLQQLYEGKAKKVFATDDPELLIVDYKDDATAFNGLKKGTIAGKGVINNQMSNRLMAYLEKQGIPTHFVKELSERETLVKKVSIVPLEVIVRNIAAGSFSKHYGVEEGVVFEQPTIEFSYKNDELGDPLLNTYHALALKLATPEEIKTIEDYSFRINDALKAFWLTCGVTLVDFKLEFGRLSDGTIVLADEIQMANTVIVGINWGDEGKGRMVDLLTENYDIVIRYQGGGNAGHTVINEHGKFALHLLPSGIFREGVVNILGNGVAVDPENLWQEMQDVAQKGVPITPDNLKISDRASLLLPWHRLQDGLEEARLKDKKYGSTKQGIAPFYSDKYQKKTIMAGELLHSEHLYEHLQDLLEWKNLTLTGVYGAEPVTMDELKAWMDNYCEKIKPFICDTGVYLRKAQAEGKKILFEAQLGALRDLDYGIYPYTTSSNAIAAYAPVGSGLPTAKIDEVIGVVKAYSTCVGEGPFVCEMFGAEADALRKAGFEYGAKTGRPRRVGPIDLVATRYGVQVQAATNIALTKLDVLSYLDKIPVCAHYELNGEVIDEFPFPTLQSSAKPVMEYMEGWKCDISGVRKWEDLPEAARNYVQYVEEKIGCRIGYVSVGPERDSIIIR